MLDEGLDNGDDKYSFGPVDMDAGAQGGFYATWTRDHSTSATNSTSNVRVAVRPPGAGGFTVRASPPVWTTPVTCSGTPRSALAGPASMGLGT